MIMPKIRLTKEFAFEMAHALEGYDGACREIHGHSYKLFVTVIGEPSDREADPKYGMVLDFGLLKAIVGRIVIDRYDHALVVRLTDDNEALVATLKERFSKVEAVDYQPTCENLVWRFARAIGAELPDGVALHSLRLHETATSYAEWYASDNA